MPPFAKLRALYSPSIGIDRQKHENSYTLFLRYEGPLPRGNDVLRGYQEFSDVPENRILHVYSLEEIATEKTLALADAGRSTLAPPTESSSRPRRARSCSSISGA